MYFADRISVYWLMLLLAFIVSVFMNLHRGKKYGYGKISSIFLTTALVLCGCIGAKILYVLENPAREFSITNGMSFFGSVFFIPLAMGIISLIARKDALLCADFYSPSVLLILAFMRYFSGCCGGRLLMLGERAIRPPAQLIECAFDLIIFAILLKTDRIGHTKGILYPLFMVMYSFVRFLIEFIRTNERIFWGFTQGQLLSGITFVLGIAVLIILKRRFSYDKR